VWEDIDDEDLIAEEDCVFTLTHNGYIKRLPTTEYNAQRRGGKGVRAMTTRRRTMWRRCSPPPPTTTSCSSPTFGKVYVCKGYKIPRRSAAARGSNIVNILPLEPGEKIATMIHGREPSTRAASS
jgi:DNA gyrase subunit A